MKGLILCAGRGTRLQPLSNSQPKTLLPVANKPVLYYCIESLVKIGITDIGIVLNKTQERSIKNKLGSGEVFGVSLTYIYQHRPKGIADAVRAAKSFINKENFILLLGDNLIQEPLLGLKDSLAVQQVNGSIMLAKVENPQDYGIAEIKGERIIGLEEKPTKPKSNLAVIGVYAFDSSIFQAIHSISPSTRGEYEITDAIQWLIDHRYSISYSLTENHYSDVGNVERWLEANRWMLDKVTNGTNRINTGSHIENCTFIHPVIVEKGCTLKNSIIGPYVSISSGTNIENCQIENSIILEGVNLKQIPQKVTDSVFGQYSVVNGAAGNWEYIEYILGDKSSVINYGIQSHVNKEKGDS